MKTVKKQVKTYIERAYCDCGGELIRENTALCSYPLQYVYHCEKCGKSHRDIIRYPQTLYEEETNE